MTQTGVVEAALPLKHQDLGKGKESLGGKNMHHAGKFLQVNTPKATGKTHRKIAHNVLFATKKEVRHSNVGARLMHFKMQKVQSTWT